MNPLPNVKVLVVDDHPLVRDGISAIVDHQDDLEVVGQAANAAEAIALFESLAPDVTLVDLGLPDMDGIGLIRILRAKSATARFIVLTAEAGGGEIAKALHAGAHAYLFKNGSSAKLFTAIRAVPTRGSYRPEAKSHLADSDRVYRFKRWRLFVDMLRVCNKEARRSRRESVRRDSSAADPTVGCRWGCATTHLRRSGAAGVLRTTTHQL